MNYTKGGWKVEFDEYAGYDCMSAGYNINCSPQLICTVDVSDYDPDDGHSACPEARANAHLIAAAPDMYEALKALASGRYYGKVEMAMTLKALAKAEGK